MTFGWAAASTLVRPITAAAVVTGRWYYIGLGVVVVVVIIALIVFYRTWEEIHDVEEPDSPADLLESFEKAHAEGDLDARELDRVRRLLAAGEASAPAIRSEGRPKDPARPAAGPTSAGEDADSAPVGGAGPSGP